MRYYTYKGKRYFPLREGTMKDPVSRKWLPCIVYYHIDHKLEEGEESAPIYVREKEDFYNKFKQVNE